MIESKLIQATRDAITTLETHGNAARDLREITARVPPDELSQADLLALRACMLRTLDTFETTIQSQVELLKSIAAAM